MTQPKKKKKQMFDLLNSKDDPNAIDKETREKLVLFL